MLRNVTRLSLQSEQSIAERIRGLNTVLARGEKVWRWTGLDTADVRRGDLVFSGQAAAEHLPGAQALKLSADASTHLVLLNSGAVALLWDKSFLWGYLAVRALRDLGFSFDLVDASGVRAGALSSYHLLVVPGGWASLKSEALGSEGRNAVRRFVRAGGAYLGLCGGAGLALQVDEGLGLLAVARKPMAERLPNFSGSIRVRRSVSHALWYGLAEEVTFQVWWPSQFEILEPETIQVLGRYGGPGDDFFVSDLNVSQAQAAGLDWRELERDYEINLDPRLLLGEPAMLEGRFGAGRVFLSYPHLETAGDAQGNLALFNLWYDLLGTAVPARRGGKKRNPPSAFDPESLSLFERMAAEAEGLVALGERLELWSWRTPWLLQWRRGVRGAEFGTVYTLLRALCEEAERLPGASHPPQRLSLMVRHLGALWRSFRERAQALLEAEAEELRGRKSEGASPELRSTVQSLRMEIFNCIHCYGSKSYGGLYRQILDGIDSLLFCTLGAR